MLGFEARADETVPMQVACPACTAEYPVNERRLPATGLKMRCPKCGSRFHVHPDGRTEGEGAAPAAAAGPPKTFAKPAVPKPSPTADLDLDLPAPKAAKPTSPAKPAAKPADLDLDLPAPKVAKPAAPAVPKPAAKSPVISDLDLPSPKAKAAPPDLDLDLPAPKKAPEPPRAKIAPPMQDLDLDLPAPKKAEAPKPAAKPALASGPDLDLDLPAPRNAKAAAAPDLDLDLPAPKPKAGATKSAEIDLDLDLDLPIAKGPQKKTEPAKPALADKGTPFDDLDLPVPKAKTPGPAAPKKQSLIDQAEEAFGDLDLPMPKASPSSAGFGELDLPAPKAKAVPETRTVPRDEFASGAVDLPAPKGDGFGELDLPAPRGLADLPTPKSDFGVDLPTPRGISDFPAAKPMDAELPVAKGSADLPAPKGAASSLAIGDLDLPEPRALPQPGAGTATAQRGGPGGTAYGELDLGGGSADDMEFADIPQGDGSSATAAPREEVVARVPRQRPEPKPAAPVRKGRAAIIAAVILGVLLAAGAGLEFTPYGMFGIYFFDRFMPGAGDPARVAAVIREAEEVAKSDRWVDLRASLRTLSAARHDAGLNRELLARSLVHESLYGLRFDDDPRRATRASSIRHRLEERRAEGPTIALAFAADALRNDNAAGAAAFLAQARGFAPNDPYVDLVGGELALARNDAAGAEEAFARAVEHGAGARGLWGIARARLAGEPGPRVQEAIDAVLRESPRHEGALMAAATLAAAANDEERVLSIARRLVGRELIDGERLRAAPRIRAEAWTLIARSEEQRGRLTAALEAYDRALAVRDAHVPALLGAGRVLLIDRPSEALARFESVQQSDEAPSLTVESGRTALEEGRLGAARAMLTLGRAGEAKPLLEQLAAARQNDAEILLWLGQAEEQTDPPNVEAAQQHYREAIDAAPDRHEAYIALAELFFDLERPSDASAVLEQVRARVADGPQMRLALGRFELRRNDLPAAIRELTHALELSPDLPAALFSLGVALRRQGELARAQETFDRLAQVDPEHPGMALERGLLYEARGDSAQAVEAYTAALEESPDDVDLQLRLGAAQVAAGAIDEAEQILERVRQARPNSAEAHHFTGRVAFARGNYADAYQHFRTAVRLDPQRGEFHLYLGWAALEGGQLGEALEAVQDAIERDPSLGEAYWIRGRVRLRAGQPGEAVPDLQRALQLRPNLHAVHADLGQAYSEMERNREAIAEYELAVQRDDDEGEWWFRLGSLRMNNGDRVNALTALGLATRYGDVSSPLPGWLPEAHRMQAEALRLGGDNDEAIRHYRRYLEIAPASAIDRQDVEETLQRLGEN